MDTTISMGAETSKAAPNNPTRKRPAAYKATCRWYRRKTLPTTHENRQATYLFTIGSYTKVNVTKGSSSHSLGNPVFLRAIETKRNKLDGHAAESTPWS